MRQVVCPQCGQTVPMNQTFLVFGNLRCENCADQELASREEPAGEGDAVAQVDPTMCRKCDADEGNRELPRVMGLPVCDACEEALRRRPYPLWVTTSFLLLLGLALFSFCHNWRFFCGFMEMRKAFRAAGQGTAEETAAWFSAAAEHVPEVPDFRHLANFFLGVDLLGKDQPAEALSPLRDAATHLPSNSPLRESAQKCLCSAEAGAAFDKKDYDAFLTKQTEALKLWPNDADAFAGVASANACKYAVTGDQKYKEQAGHYLELAMKRDDGKDMSEYRQRILYRLHSREIIDKKEYQHRFPTGWVEEAKP